MEDFTAHTQKEMIQRVPHIIGSVNAFKICSVNYKPVHPVGVLKKIHAKPFAFMDFLYHGCSGPSVPLRNLSGTGVSAGWPTPSRPTLPVPPLWVLAPLGLFQPPVISVGYLPH